MESSTPGWESLELRTDDGLMLSGLQVVGPGRQVLLSHGFGQTRQSWTSTQRRLRLAGHGSLAMDARGHGRSGRNPPGRPYQADQFVADQVLAARHLGPGPVLVGASMGGLTGLVAQAQAHSFSALVLVDVTPTWEEAGMLRIQAFTGAHAEGFDDFDQAADAIAAFLPHRRARKTRAQLEPLLRQDEQGRLRWHWDPRLLPEFVAGSSGLQEAISQAASAIDVPVLLLSGGRSDLVSDRTIEHFLQRVPHARHIRLPQATHMLAGDDNDAFADAVLEFLRAQSPSTAAGRHAPGPSAVENTPVPGVAR